MTAPRLAVRAVILRAGRLLLVNAWPGRTHLWCAPGGGVLAHASLPENLAREVEEETGLVVEVGMPCLVNEFHDPGRFHQVEIFFRCEATGDLSADWRDPEGVVTAHRWVTRPEAEALAAADALRPRALAAAAWDGGVHYDPLERILR